MKRYNSQKQLSIAQFAMQFETTLDENTVGYSFHVIPWDKFAELYYKIFPFQRGAPTKDARMVLGVVIIKHLLKLDDIGLIEIIQENPYMQYFHGLKGGTQKPVFDPSLLGYIPKRMDLNVFESLTDELIRKGLKITPVSKKEPTGDDDADSSLVEETKNKGRLQLDATVADAAIKFPPDLDLLNDSRVKAESLIDHLCVELGVKEKPRTYRKVARKEYLHVSKMKRKPDKVLRRGLRLQINYLKRDVSILEALLYQVKEGHIPFDKHQYKYYFVIQEVLRQQEAMFKAKTNSSEDRIVSIHQPHVRTNRAWLKERNIRHTGDPLGRKPVKNVKSYYTKRKERREAAERNQIEGKFGQGKNGYNLNRIRVKLSSTSMSWIAVIIFVMNLIRYTRDFSSSVWKRLLANVMRIRDEVASAIMPIPGNLAVREIIQ